MPPIKIKITSDAESAEELSEKESIEAKHPQISLNARKTVDGKIMIMDHRDIDIVIFTTYLKRELSTEPPFKAGMSLQVFKQNIPTQLTRTLALHN